MKILIFGATGMLGHRLFIELSKHHEVWGTRGGNWFPDGLPKERFLRLHVDGARWYDRLRNIFEETKPDVVINCIANIRPTERFKIKAIQVNAELPQELMFLTHEYDARLIHFSTDAVFSGKRGMYTENDTPDATDVYGMTKRLGEVTADDATHALTLRCCPIGRELPLRPKDSLVEWFLAQSGTVKGYNGAWFSPLTTHEIARVLNTFVLPRADLHGLYHLGGYPLNKYMLLLLLNRMYKHGVDVEAFDNERIDRSLDSMRFSSLVGYIPPVWDDMIEEMAADNALYEKVAI